MALATAVALFTYIHVLLFNYLLYIHYYYYLLIIIIIIITCILL